MSQIAHTNRDLAGPYDRPTLDRLIDALPSSPRTVLDLGCGEGSTLAWILERFPEATAVGVDLALGRAHQRTASVAARVELVEADATEVKLESADLVMCVGATHIFGGLEQTLEALIPLADQHLLIGDGFWEHPPSEEALHGLGGAAPDEFTDLLGALATAEQRSLRVVHTEVSTQEQWDTYEQSWCDALEAFANQNRSDPDAEAFIEVAMEHRRGYLEGYRGFLGFVLMLLER